MYPSDRLRQEGIIIKGCHFTIATKQASREKLANLLKKDATTTNNNHQEEPR